MDQCVNLPFVPRYILPLSLIRLHRYLNNEEQVFEAEDWLEINENICIEFQAEFKFPMLELDRPKVRVSRLMRAQGEDVGKLFELETKVGDE